MSDAAPANKKSAPKKPAEHPKHSKIVEAAIVALKECTGSSRITIVKYLKAKYNVHLKMAHKKVVAGGTLA